MNRSVRCALYFLLTALASERALGAPLFQEVIDRNYSVPADASISLRNTDGTVYVYGSNEGGMRVIARKRAYSQARLDAIAVNVSVEGGAVTIDTVYPPTPGGFSLADRSGTVDYTIIVPQTCAIARIELGNGEITIQGMRGAAVNARLTNGRILALNCFSATRLSVGNGTLNIRQNWWERLRFSVLAEIGNGDLLVALPADAAVQIDASAVNGGIRNEFSRNEKMDAGRKLNITIGTEANADFKLRTSDGNIRIGKE